LPFLSPQAAVFFPSPPLAREYRTGDQALQEKKKKDLIYVRGTDSFVLCAIESICTHSFILSLSLPWADTIRLGTHYSSYHLPPFLRLARFNDHSAVTMGFKDGGRFSLLNIVTLIFRFLQFVFAIAVVGLYAQDLNKARGLDKYSDSKWVRT
jgi:hypothetical protein